VIQGVVEPGVQVGQVRPPALAKRLFDMAFATVALIALLPPILLLMLAICLESWGSPIFAQERVGLGGRRFKMLKLRTMVRDAERRRVDVEHLNEAQAPMFKVKKDPRITRVGRFLRYTSLDELPQLINVIVGEMSLVGPRPPLPHEVGQYTSTQARRLTVIPGLTGLWQVSGRSDRSFDALIALDLEYIDHWSFWLDLKLIARTVWVVLSGRGAY
jgi:lipopolysaccharide/colanic/teichoic acid biosynthesis glycosyltransferase